jgi:hypothetical protein
MRHEVWLLVLAAAVFSPLVHTQQLRKIVGRPQNGRIVKVELMFLFVFNDNFTM